MESTWQIVGFKLEASNVGSFHQWKVNVFYCLFFLTPYSSMMLSALEVVIHLLNLGDFQNLNNYPCDMFSHSSHCNSSRRYNKTMYSNALSENKLSLDNSSKSKVPFTYLQGFKAPNSFDTSYWFFDSNAGSIQHWILGTLNYFKTH